MPKELSFFDADMTLVYREIRRHPEQLQPVEREDESNISDYTGARR